MRGPEEPTLPPASRAPVTIRDITFSEELDYTRVAIEGSDELMYESLELLEDPLRISVEIPNVAVEAVTPIPVDNGTVTEITSFADAESGRVEIGLADRVPYNITQEANNLYIDIERGMVARPIEVEEPAVVEEIETAPVMETPATAATTLTDVSVTRRDDVTEVTFAADGVIGDYNSFTLKSPPRLVIDLWNLKSRLPKRTVRAETSHLKQVRIGQHPKKTRLVLDASGSTLPPYRVDRFENGLVITLGVGDSPKQNAVGMLAGVDFKQIDDKSRVVLSSSQKVDYEIFKLAEGDVIVDLKRTTTPKHLKRVLDTRAFDSAVESIHLYNVRSETSKDVRVVIHLREMVDFEAFQENDRIFVDFQKPRGVRGEESRLATPSVASEGEQGQEVVAAQEEEIQATTEVDTVDRQDAPEVVTEETGVPSAVNEEVEAGTTDVKLKDPVPAETPKKQEDVATEIMAKMAVPATETATQDSFYELALTPGKQYAGRRLSLDFKDAEIKNILRLIAEVSELNIVAGEDVKGKVTIRLIDVPWDQALDIILFSNNLGKMRMGNVIRVAPVEVLKTEQEQLLSSKRTKEKLEDLETELIPVNYSTAAELQAQVKNILSERGSISIDARTNTLIIKDIPTVVAEATVLVERLDTRTPQVVIEARIVEAATNFSRELGIKWGGTSDTVELGGGPGTVGIEGSVPGASPADTVADFAIGGATSAITFNLADLGSIANLDIELSALEEAGEGEIISAPRITTLDNKEASIEQGLRIPYLKLTAEGTATTEFIEANIKLIVTPHVTNDGHIKMTIKASKDSPDDSITVQGVPAIDKKEAITEVLVENGDVVVIAGLYSIEKANNVDRIPLLGNVPLLGALFKSTEITDDRRDLLIFISPKIVHQAV
jgi:type IV pilus assembly protein PilQ